MKAFMNKNDENSEKLLKVTENEWKEILDQFTRWVYFRLQGLTLYGAHSEQNLGLNPVDYYVGTAIEKLYNGEWKWKDEHTLLDQLKRIAGSMMSENVRKYEQKSEKIVPLDDEMLDSLNNQESNDEDEEEERNQREKLYEILNACSADDKELSLYVTAFEMYGNYKDICAELGWELEKAYAMQKKLLRRAKRYVGK
jgi:hypothetical protein